MSASRTQDLVAEADVADDRPLEVLELDARLDVGERAERLEALRRDGAAGNDLRLGEERALEGLEAQRAAQGEVLVGVHGGGDEHEVAARERANLRAQAVAAVSGEVELDAPREVEQRLELGAVGDSVERDTRAAVGEPADGLDERLVVALGGRDLEHDPVGADGHGADLEKELAPEREPRGVAAGERLEADLGQGVGDDGGAVDEQLEAEQAHLGVDHGLARDEDLAGGRGGRGMRSGGHLRPVIVPTPGALEAGPGMTASVRGSWHERSMRDRVAARPAFRWT
jgi:hypothetical protein